MASRRDMGSAFAARMAWREMRGAGRHVLYALACITIGVCALVAVGSFAASLERTVGARARSLMGGDVEIRAAQPLSREAEAAVAELARQGALITHVRELYAMARLSPTGGASATGADGRDGSARVQLVELKVVEPGYPLYGQLSSDPDRPLSTLIGDGRALVHPSLLARLGLAAGDSLRVGEADFTISGVIREEPDRSVGVFSLGPRVLIGAGDLARTQLVQPGSRVRYRTLLRLADGRSAEAVSDLLATRLPGGGFRVATYTQAQPGLRRFWQQLTMYLGLTGLVALMVGGIGVAASVRAFVGEKLATIAILKCLGAAWPTVLAVYLVQTALLGLTGSLLGAALGSALQVGVGRLVAPLLPFAVEFSLSPLAVLRGLGMGLGVTLLFSLWPLLEIRRVPPALILRRPVEAAPAGARPWFAVLPIAAGLAALAFWQAGSWKVGGLFAAGLAGALAALSLSTRLIMAASKRLRRASASLAWRQGLANLHRPGTHAGVVLVSLGLAVMLVVSVALLERSLRAQFTEHGPDRAPAFFFIDIQPDQTEAFARVVESENGGLRPELAPVVRSRLSRVKGAALASDPRARREDAWYLTREYVLTWAKDPPGHNTLVTGRWWTPGEAAQEPLISVEEELAGHLGVGLGDTLTFDVQGTPITGRVMNLRKVEWQTWRSNFFVIFSPGALDGAPMAYIATARVRPEREHTVQGAVAAAFPNVSAIPVREVLERLGAVLDQISLAIRLVAGVSILAGIVVMAGALSVTRHQRLYQSVIWKALGATRLAVARAFAVEYALLGAASGLSGTALAAGLAWAVLYWLLEVPWAWSPSALVLGVASATVLSLAVGFLGTFRLLGQKPLGVLRGE